MATSSTAPKPSPERIVETITAYQRTAAIKAAIELDLFTAIAGGREDARTIAGRTGVAERGARILCDYLTIHGFLTKENGKYGLTPDTAVFLNKKSPAYMGSILGFLLGERQTSHFARLTEAVVKGGAASQHGDNSKPNDEAWVPFAKSMGKMTGVSAAFLAALTGAADGKPSRVLDIAAGHGMFGITIAAHNPNAEITALDWPAVLEIARENAQAAGVSERYKLLPGNAFEADLGHGYDFVLLTNIFHHFDPAGCQALMKRVHGALKPGGKAITLEFVPNEDRVSPPMAAGFSLVMLATTDAGDAYTFPEYEKMFHNAGFTRTTLHPVPDMPQHALVSEK